MTDLEMCTRIAALSGRPLQEVQTAYAQLRAIAPRLP
jgi:hypothetical protein